MANKYLVFSFPSNTSLKFWRCADIQGHFKNNLTLHIITNLLCNQQLGKKKGSCVQGTWSSSVTLAGRTGHQHNLCFIHIFPKAPMCCKLGLNSLMVLVSRWTQVHIDTWIIWKLFHSKQTLDNTLNIPHTIQVSRLTKRRGEGEKGRWIYLVGHLLTYYLISPFKCTVSHPTTWILCSFLAKEGGASHEMAWTGSVLCLWLCSWESLAMTGWGGQAAQLRWTWTFESVGQEKPPLPSVRHHEDRRGSRCLEFLGRKLSYNGRLPYV